MIPLNVIGHNVSLFSLDSGDLCHVNHPCALLQVIVYNGGRRCKHSGTAWSCSPGVDKQRHSFGIIVLPCIEKWRGSNICPGGGIGHRLNELVAPTGSWDPPWITWVCGRWPSYRGQPLSKGR